MGSFMYSKEAADHADAVRVFSEGLANFKSYTSPANLEKEMKGILTSCSLSEK